MAIKKAIVSDQTMINKTIETINELDEFIKDDGLSNDGDLERELKSLVLYFKKEYPLGLRNKVKSEA